jgi:hypothetical protein
MTCSSSSDVYKAEVHEERLGHGIAQSSAQFKGREGGLGEGSDGGFENTGTEASA